MGVTTGMVTEDFTIDQMESSDEPDTCAKCGKPMRKHRRDPMSGRPQCPVLREQSPTPAQEHHRSPRADY